MREQLRIKYLCKKVMGTVRKVIGAEELDWYLRDGTIAVLEIHKYSQPKIIDLSPRKKRLTLW